MLESKGYRITSAFGFTVAMSHCTSGTKFDLFILGHSIPMEDKEALIQAFRENCSAPILALTRGGELPVEDADFQVEPEPSELLALVDKIITGDAAAA
jgi:hypothetical protein